MKKRQPLTPELNTVEVMALMWEGNPGAMSVIAQLFKLLGEEALIFLGYLDDMNIRGGQIWVAYKDHCKSDINILYSLIKARDSNLVDTINKECDYGGEKAVCSKPSFDLLNSRRETWNTSKKNGQKSTS